MDALQGVHAKLTRARTLRDELRQSVEQWRDGEPFSLEGSSKDELTEHRFTFREHEPPHYVEWAVLAGDCAHNLRSALDHLAWQLAELGDGGTTRTEFPIFLEEEQYERHAGRKVEPMTADAQRALERLQPYHREAPETDALWVLHRLNIIDKHRLLTPILSQSLDVGFGGRFEFHDEEQAHPPILQAWDGPLEDGRVVLIVTTPAPTKRALMDVSFTAGVGLTVDDVLLGGVDGVLGNLVSAVAGTIEVLTGHGAPHPE